jgi:hypothetical protein
VRRPGAASCVLLYESLLRAYGAQVHLDAGPLVEEYVALSETPRPRRRNPSPLRIETWRPTWRSWLTLTARPRAGGNVRPCGRLVLIAFKLSHADRPSPVLKRKPGPLRQAERRLNRHLTTAAAEKRPPAPVTTAVAEKSNAIVPLQPDPLTMDVRASDSCGWRGPRTASA